MSRDNPNKADAASERIITAIDWPQFNHNGRHEFSETELRAVVAYVLSPEFAP